MWSMERLAALLGEVHLTANCAVRRPVCLHSVTLSVTGVFSFFTEYYKTGPRKDEGAQEVHNT